MSFGHGDYYPVDWAPLRGNIWAALILTADDGESTVELFGTIVEVAAPLLNVAPVDAPLHFAPIGDGKVPLDGSPTEIVWTAGPLLERVTGDSRRFASLIAAARRWWLRFEGKPLMGPPPSISREDIVKGLRALKVAGTKVTGTALATELGCDRSTLYDAYKREGIDPKKLSSLL